MFSLNDHLWPPEPTIAAFIAVIRLLSAIINWRKESIRRRHIDKRGADIEKAASNLKDEKKRSSL